MHIHLADQDNFRLVHTMDQTTDGNTDHEDQAPKFSFPFLKMKKMVLPKRCVRKVERKLVEYHHEDFTIGPLRLGDYSPPQNQLTFHVKQTVSRLSKESQPFLLGQICKLSQEDIHILLKPLPSVDIATLTDTCCYDPANLTEFKCKWTDHPETQKLAKYTSPKGQDIAVIAHVPDAHPT